MKQELSGVRRLLERVSSELDSLRFPEFEAVNGIRGAPGRHPYMAAVVWYLAEREGCRRATVLEIGSYVGASLFTWVEALERYMAENSTVFSIDPLVSFLKAEIYDAGALSKVGEIEEAVRFDFAYQILRRNLAAASTELTNCVHLRCFSEDMLPALRSGYFDLIYVDGNHGYRGVREDLIQATRLIAEGGILCGDDLKLQFDECDAANAEKFAQTDFIEDPRTGVSFHPGVSMAVWEVLGRVSSWEGFWAMQRRQGEWRPISLADAPLRIPAHFPERLRAQLERELPRMRALCDNAR